MFPERTSTVGQEYIYSEVEHTELRGRAGFTPVSQGTFSTPDRSLFLYDDKRGLEVNGMQQAIEALAFVRYATARGILHPDTQWGAYLRRDGSYQLFAVSPRLVTYEEHLRNPNPDRQQIMIIPKTSRFKGPDDESPHIIAWQRRLDPAYDPDNPDSPTSLTNMLNIMEASHKSNWGWGKDDNLYPLDVEVLEVSARPQQEALIHQWYEQYTVAQR